MNPTMSLADLARGYGYTRPRSLRSQLDNLGVHAHGRETGRTGYGLYDPTEVAVKLAGRTRLRNAVIDTRLGLSDDHARMIVEAMHGIYLDTTWAADPAGLLSAEIADSYADDEDGPEPARADLAKQVADWPKQRAFTAALAAHAALRLVHDGATLPAAMQEVGLVAAP